MLFAGISEDVGVILKGFNPHNPSPVNLYHASNAEKHCTARIARTLLEELLTDELTPAFTHLPRPTWITDVGALERYLQHTPFRSFVSLQHNKRTVADLYDRTNVR